MRKGTKAAQQEPILSAVARRLGHAAGKVARVTQEVTGSLSSAADAMASSVNMPKLKTNSPRRRAAAASPAPKKRKPAKKRASPRGARRGNRA